MNFYVFGGYGLGYEWGKWPLDQENEGPGCFVDNELDFFGFNDF